MFRVEKGGDPDIVRKSQAARFDRVEDVDDVIALDLEWRKGEIALESLGPPTDRSAAHSTAGR